MSDGSFINPHLGATTRPKGAVVFFDGGKTKARLRPRRRVVAPDGMFLSRQTRPRLCLTAHFLSVEQALGLILPRVWEPSDITNPTLAQLLPRFAISPGETRAGGLVCQNTNQSRCQWRSDPLCARLAHCGVDKFSSTRRLNCTDRVGVLGEEFTECRIAVHGVLE